MEKFLRKWREDAASKNQYESAIFVGDKVLALTDSSSDAISLAYLHFSVENYTRALSLLTRRELINRNAQCKYLAAHCHVKQGRFDDALTILGDKTPPTVTLSSRSSTGRKVPRTDVQNYRKTGQRARSIGDTLDDTQMDESTRKRYEAGMCYLRGICYAKQNAFDRARDCYKDAVRIDIQCFEAFDQLVRNALLSPDEEWDFLDSLNFDNIAQVTDPSNSQQAGELTKMLYITRLSKYKNTSTFTAATETLSTHYKLASNPDLLLAKAELLFIQCRFREALNLTESILEEDRYNFATLPVHLACLHELNERNALFLLAHELSDRHQDEPATWLAVGVYYLTIGKIAEARRFFSKSSEMDPHFGPAWVGFAHTFAAEGEHDQAIAAYTTSARLFQGTHLPQLFLGMQNLQLFNMPLAREYLNTAYRLCQTDPLLLNEMGVIFSHEDDLESAINVFNAAISTAQSTDSEPRAWIAIRVNLGHAYRRSERYQEALEEFEEVIRQNAGDAGVFSAKALVLMEMDRPWDAVVTLHEALSINPQDPIGNDLLAKALEETARIGDARGNPYEEEGGGEGPSVGPFRGGVKQSFGSTDEEMDGILQSRLQEATDNEKIRRQRRAMRANYASADENDNEIGRG